jgi:hypothetical protein
MQEKDCRGVARRGVRRQVEEKVWCVCGGGATHPKLQLAQGLKEDQGLYVAHRAAHLYQANVGRVTPALLGVHHLVGDAVQPALNGVRDVGNDLHRLAQVVTPALRVDHLAVHLARGEVVVTRQRHVKKALIVAQVQVRLAAVVQHKHLAVLKGAHGARVAVQVGVNLYCRHIEARGL